MSQFELPSTWRLGTSGGIPYRFMGMDGTFTDEDGSANWRAIIPATSLVAFVTELFPAPLVVGNKVIPRGATMPGFPGMNAKRVRFKAQDDALPIDPFSYDPGAAAGTYNSFIEVDVEFGTGFKQPNPDDPRTFLEITATASGEYLHAAIPGAKWVPQTNENSADSNVNADDDFLIADPDTGELKNPDTKIKKGDEEVNRSPDVPHATLVPTTEWNLKWTQIPYDTFFNTIIHRVRLLLGKVNSTTWSVLFNARPETLLFAGYSYSTQYTWRDDQVETPPVQLEIKILEKRVIWKGVICGHNHFWRPGKGWQILLIDGTNKAFGGYDFNFLFKV